MTKSLISPYDQAVMGNTITQLYPQEKIRKKARSSHREIKEDTLVPKKHKTENEATYNLKQKYSGMRLRKFMKHSKQETLLVLTNSKELIIFHKPKKTNKGELYNSITAISQATNVCQGVEGWIEAINPKYLEF